MKLISLIFISIVFYGNALYAQDILTITSIEEANKKLANFIFLYEDSTNTLDIKQVLAKKEQDFFVPVLKFRDIISPENTYWLYFSFENNLGKDYPLGLYISKQNHNVEINAFSDSTYYVQHTGFFLKSSNNDEVIPFTNIVQVQNIGSIKFYIKIKNINDQVPDFSIKLVDLRIAAKRNNSLVNFDGIVLGMILLMFFYGLFLFFQNKVKLFLYYSLYVLLVGIWIVSGLGLGYRIFPDLSREIDPFTPFPFLLGQVFYLQFIRLFLNTSQVFPKWDKLLRSLQIISFLGFLGLIVFVPMTNLVILSYRIENISMLIMNLIYYAFIIRILLLKTKLTNIVALGASFLLLGNIVGAISYLIFIDEIVFVPTKIGILCELLVYAYGISYMYSLIEADKQKFQKQLIAQLNENAELQGKVNRELSEKVKEATAEIVARNKEITDSIHYASLIQTAVLLPINFLTEWGIENFILYKPKDVVSGDFYWGKKKNGRLIIAAVDCTGHGVPGAFMSMLGHAFLDEIINTIETDNAAAILDRMREEVIATLKQKGKRGEAKDGMDMALCIIDKKAGQLMYSGANNPLYLIRDNNLIKTEADKMPIGIHSTSLIPFTNQKLEIRKGDYIYLFSDGYADQFGGPYGKKFMYTPFQDLIIRNHTKPMEQQKEILDNAFEKWKGDREQIDDVMVIGLKI